MDSISIGEIQKNISLLTKLEEPITIVDKRRNKSVAVVYPTKQHSIVSSLAGKYKGRVQSINDLESAKEEALKEAFGEKYGLSY